MQEIQVDKVLKVFAGCLSVKSLAGFKFARINTKIFYVKYNSVWSSSVYIYIYIKLLSDLSGMSLTVDVHDLLMPTMVSWINKLTPADVHRI